MWHAWSPDPRQHVGGVALAPTCATSARRRIGVVSKTTPAPALHAGDLQVVHHEPPVPERVASPRCTHAPVPQIFSLPLQPFSRSRFSLPLQRSAAPLARKLLRRSGFRPEIRAWDLVAPWQKKAPPQSGAAGQCLGMVAGLVGQGRLGHFNGAVGRPRPGYLAAQNRHHGDHDDGRLEHDRAERQKRQLVSGLSAKLQSANTRSAKPRPRR
jgi:hypothetical protein